MGIMSTIKTAFSDSTQKRILVIKLYGAITEQNSSNFNSTFSAFKLVQKLLTIKEEKNYDGILLRINSPGGNAAASEEVAEALQQIKRTSNIPIITSIGDLCASGTYLIASATDKIFANRMSLVGSIGAIMSIPNAAELADKIGIKIVTASSGKMKDLGNPTREITIEEKEYLDNLVNEAAEQFKAIVINNRQIIKNFDEMTDGRVVCASEALANNLIDEIGTYNDVLSYFCTYFKVTPARIKLIEYTEKTTLIDKLIHKTLVNFAVPFINLKF